ncbi:MULTISPECIES: hypothetical protein [Streptomyces]|uniref:Uncharacterized protein n=1 Tax=Streptomyces caniscabiei TaxID=2746961 RepID=A0ABU4MKW0_9ACTN|nr:MULTISPECIES: hypothetical protein [Streptomyces]MBE4735168.1 hypothetical protein [Streptomyces caniscabiei]MBE4754302.1 hypothetical protein [Streptomyces caniscabiei]MBE4767894.1 hypothetical protein [Streptomyces caniscabiei]MBE4784350.1 hypothetical protein [Streptomyces caniscabiei]MBE4791151.1 hypothetical protein [Streptomyces caniscabiei]
MPQSNGYIRMPREHTAAACRAATAPATTAPATAVSAVVRLSGRAPTPAPVF